MKLCLLNNNNNKGGGGGKKKKEKPLGCSASQGLSCCAVYWETGKLQPQTLPNILREKSPVFGNLEGSETPNRS